MPLPPHVHLFLPSSTPAVLLEARLYLPLTRDSSLPLSTTQHSTPSATLDTSATVKRLGIKRLVTASHPWGRLGGNMLDPIIVDHLLPLALQDPLTAVMSYNVRGVGRSQGSKPWVGLGLDVEDFGAVERGALELIGEEVEIWRFGYSYGSILALNAPASQPLRSILILSPPLSMYNLFTLFASQTFASGLQRAAAEGVKLIMVYGTRDDFTGVESYRALQKEGLGIKEIEGAGHFFRSCEEGEALRRAISAWLHV
ncbi:hypothetical protein P7C73_g1445, partial [Tremellales sp. Uapishka_1]